MVAGMGYLPAMRLLVQTYGNIKMSKLQIFGRPYVIFDAADKNHRRWFAEFNRRAAWGNCPVRFVIDDENGDLVTMIQRKLIQYYVDREFGKPAA